MTEANYDKIVNEIWKNDIKEFFIYIGLPVVGIMSILVITLIIVKIMGYN